MDALIWASSTTTFLGTTGTTQKLGVMFIESAFPLGTPSAPRIPWNVRSSLTYIVSFSVQNAFCRGRIVSGLVQPLDTEATKLGRRRIRLPGIS